MLQSYERSVSDEFIEPASFNGFSGIGVDDGVIFINFRNDRARELCAALGDESFGEFERKFVVQNLITMSEYDASFKFPLLFEKPVLKNTLCEVIAEAGLTQLHTAETEKYAHVTFFFNGGVEEPLPNETRVLIPSPKVKTYDEQPQMSAPAVCDAVIRGIEAGIDFIVVNFANGDMVGHTGNYDAAVKAVEAVDECIGKILGAAARVILRFRLRPENHVGMVVAHEEMRSLEEIRIAFGRFLQKHHILVDDAFLRKRAENLVIRTPPLFLTPPRVEYAQPAAVDKGRTRAAAVAVVIARRPKDEPRLAPVDEIARLKFHPAFVFVLR